MASGNTVVHVLFVCLGNICRSPLAEGVFREQVTSAGLADHIMIDSAGTGAWHVGNPPDPRGQASAANRKLDISGQRARKVAPEDFSRFDYIVAMDRSNLATLQDLAPASTPASLQLFLDFAPSKMAHTVGGEVPDPYYGGAEGFEPVLDMIEAASTGLLAHITYPSRLSS